MKCTNRILVAATLTFASLNMQAYAQDACDPETVVNPAIDDAATSNSCNLDGTYINPAFFVGQVKQAPTCKGIRGRSEKVLNAIRLLKSAGVNLFPQGTPDSLRTLRQVLYAAIKDKCQTEHGPNPTPSPEPTHEPKPTPSVSPSPAPTPTVDQLVQEISKLCKKDSQPINCGCVNETIRYLVEHHAATSEVAAQILQRLTCHS